MWHWLFYSLPLWLQILLIGIPALALLFMAVRLFGWANVSRWIGPVLALFGVGVFLVRERKAGYADRKIEEQATEKKADTVVEQKRQQNETKTDAEVKKETKRWSR